MAIGTSGWHVLVAPAVFCRPVLELALRLFPDAYLHWLSDCGHFPQLDVPEEATQLILDVTNRTYQPQSE